MTTPDYDDLSKELRDPQSHSEPRLWRVRDAAADAIAALREQVAACTQGSDLGYTRLENVGLRKRAEKAEADNAALRQALQELIALKDIKDSNFGVIRSMTAASESLRLDYERRKPLAWDAARAAMREGKKP